MGFDKREKLIYDLIFGDKTDYEIDIADYISNIYNYKEFVADIKKILKKSKVRITYSRIDIDIKTATWNIKIEK